MMDIDTGENQYTIKPYEVICIGFFGDSGVGKSTLISRLKNKTWQESQFIKATTGVEYVELPGFTSCKKSTAKYTGPELIDVKILCTDTMGQELFRAIVDSYYRNVDLAVITCAANDQQEKIADTFKYYVPRIRIESEKVVRRGRRPKYIVGILNKLDLVATDDVADLKAFFTELCCEYKIENHLVVSAKTIRTVDLRESLDSYIEKYFIQPQDEFGNMTFTIAPKVAPTHDLEDYGIHVFEPTGLLPPQHFETIQERRKCCFHM